MYARNYLIVLFYILSSLTFSFAMEVTEGNFDDEDAQEIADIHYRYAFANTQHGRAANSTQISNAEFSYNLLGNLFNTQEVTDGFFTVDWIEKLQAEHRLPTEIAAIYRFLKRHGFIRPLKTIFVFDLLNARKIPAHYAPLLAQILPQFTSKNEAKRYYSQAENRENCIQFYPSPQHKGTTLDRSELGLLVRMQSDRNLEHEISKYPWFFEEAGTTKDLMRESIRSMIVVSLRLHAIKEILEAKETPSKVFENLLATDKIPASYKKVMYRLRHQPEKAIKKIQSDIDSAITVLNTRRESQAKIFHSRLDVLLLYVFYLIDESLGYVIKDDQSLGILHTFADEPGLSIKEILAPLAHEVLERLGFDPQKDSSEPQISITEQKVKKSSKKNRRRGKSKSLLVQAPVMQNQISDNSLCDIKAIDAALMPVSTDTSLDEECELLNDALKLDVVAAERDSSEDDFKKGKEMESPQPESWASICARTSPTLNQKPHDFSHAGNCGAKLVLDSGIRRLDTLARLIAREMVYSKHTTTGTVALALVNIKGRDHIVISTKRFTPPWQIIDAVQDAIDNSLSFYKSQNDVKSVLADLKKSAREAKHNLSESDTTTSDLINVFYETRMDIDRLKLAKTLLGGTKSHLETRLAHALGFPNGFDREAFIVLPNSLSVHPEMNVGEYLIENKLPLGAITSQQHMKPYQYIGLSMLNCGTCDVMLRGGNKLRGLNDAFHETKLLLFTRGHYDFSYPGYLVPFRIARINHMSLREVRGRMNLHLQDIKSIPMDKSVALQNADISDSDDDEASDF